MVFTGPFQYNQEQRVAIRAMADVLQTKLLEVLREDLGGTYSVSVSPNYAKIPREEYTLAIDFGCSPARTDELVKTVLQQIDLLKTAGPTDKQVADVRQKLLRDLETNSKSNGFYLTNISLRYEYRRGPDEPVQSGGLLQQADAGRDSGGSEDVSEHGQLRAGGAVSRKEVNTGFRGSPEPRKPPSVMPA